MTGRQEYDRTKDRQRILDEYMIDLHNKRSVSIVAEFLAYPLIFGTAIFLAFLPHLLHPRGTTVCLLAVADISGYALNFLFCC
jgi:hypothetical protein